MCSLDIADSRVRLEPYAAAGLVGGATAELVGQLEQGESTEIFDEAEGSDGDDALDRATALACEGAAFDSGTD